MGFGRSRSSEESLRYDLVVLSHDGSSVTISVDDAPVIVGRSPRSTICLNEEAASRQHCVISPAQGRLMLLDQGSTNGTKVNGRRVKRAKLSHGDVIEVGSSSITVRAHTDSSLVSSKSEVLTPEANHHPLPHKQLALLRRLISELASRRSVESIARSSLEVIARAFPVERGFIISWTGPGSEHQILGSWTRGARTGEEQPELDQDLLDRVLCSGRPERLLGVTGGDPEASRFVLCGPLRRGAEVVGAVYLDGAMAPEWVSSREALSLLISMSDLVALALTTSGQEGGRPSSADSILSDLRRTTRIDALKQDSSEMNLAALQELGSLDEGQRRALESLHADFERRVAERSEVIKDQRIELVARLTELEHVQTAKAQMSRTLVHDIKGLVAALDANLDFALIGLSPESEEATSLKWAKHCSARIVAMASDVLDVSRMERGDFPMQPNHVMVSSLLVAALRRHAAQAREVPLQLALGEIEDGLMVHADPEVLARVIDNLIANAIRYAGRSGSIILSARTAESATEIMVVDSGPGIAPERRAQVFDEFVQGGKADKRRHSGIGLYFCRLAVEAHGGAIRVEGQSGDNRMVLSLPLLESRSGSSSDDGRETTRPNHKL